MIVYHGTTMKRARRICKAGFLPRKPSKRVWFAKARSKSVPPVVLGFGKIDSQYRRRYYAPFLHVRSGPVQHHTVTRSADHCFFLAW